MSRDGWDKEMKVRLMVCLHEAGLTFTDIGEIFDFSRQWVENLLRWRVAHRTSGWRQGAAASMAVPIKRRWVEELVSLGLSTQEVAVLWGISYTSAARLAPEGKSYAGTVRASFRTTVAALAYREARHALFVSAYASGASLVELGEIFGVGYGGVVSAVNRLRKAIPNPPPQARRGRPPGTPRVAMTGV